MSSRKDRRDDVDEGEETFDVQAGAGQSTEADRRRRRQQAAPGGGDAATRAEEDEGWEDESEASEDLYPDTSRPEPDDLVRLRAGYENKASLRVMLKTTTETEKKHPLFDYGLKLGTVLAEDDPRLEYHDDLDNAYVPVLWYVTDDRVSSASHKRIEFVHEDALEVLNRPFTANEMIVADGDTGMVEEVEQTFHLRQVTFPAFLRSVVPRGADRLVFGTLDLPEVVNPTVAGSSGAHGDGASSGSDAEPPAAAHHQQPSQHHWRHSRHRRSAHSNAGAGKKARRADPSLNKFHRPPYPQTLEEWIADSATRSVPQSMVLPFHPFRREVCVVNRETLLIGVVTEVTEYAIVAFRDGSVAVCTDFERNSAKTSAGDVRVDDRPPSIQLAAPVRFTYADASDALHFILPSQVPSWTYDDDVESTVLEGCVVGIIAGDVQCSFTPDAGLNWDLGVVQCHPADLVPLDQFYSEFTSTQCYVLDDELRDRLHESIRATVAGAAAEAATTPEADRNNHGRWVDAVNELFAERTTSWKDRLRNIKSGVSSVPVEPSPAYAPTAQLQADLAASEAANSKRKSDDNKSGTSVADDDAPPVFQTTSDDLRKLLGYTERDDPDVLLALCGSLTPVEYVAFYQAFCRPRALPPSWYDMVTSGASLSESQGEWLPLLMRIADHLPFACSARSFTTTLTVSWNRGKLEQGVDGRTVVLRQEQSEQDNPPPPEVLRIVAPSSVRAAAFPIDMATSGRCITERVGDFDMVDLPESHYAATAGDVVFMKCRSDYDREFGDEPPEAPYKVLGRVLECNEADRTCVVHWTAANLEGVDTTRDAFPEACDPDLNDPLFAAAAAVDPVFGKLRLGCVLRLRNDGIAVVRWWNGQLENVPSPLLSVVRFLETEELLEQQQEGDEEEEEEEEEASSGPPATSGQSADAPATTGSNIPGGVMGMVVQKAKNLARLFGGKKTATAETSAEAAQSDAPEENSAPPPSTSAPDVDAATATIADMSLATPPAEASNASPVAEQRGTFTCVSTFSAHLLRNEAIKPGATVFSPAEPKKFYKRVQTEWKLLQQELPSGVHVKVSEEEMHLMKFLIRGPIHTPYFQGIYAFDLLFPGEFPHKPPMVKFHSYNVRMNPNLYDNGYVCLSLLGTWRGENATEEWNPVTSNVLQIILALQAMVLNKEPYFNEPGFEDSMGTEKGRQRSRLANEGYYLLKLTHLSSMASAPPADWIFEVRQHVRTYMPRVLARAQKYVEGATTVDGDASPKPGAINSDGLVLPLSKGFFVSLPLHVNALRAKTADLVQSWEREDAAHNAAAGLSSGSDADAGTTSA